MTVTRICAYCGHELIDSWARPRAKYCDLFCAAKDRGRSRKGTGEYHARNEKIVMAINQGVSMSEIAQTYGITKQRVYQIKKQIDHTNS